MWTPLTEDFHLAVWHEFQHSNVDQILNLVLKGPTVVGVMSRAIRVVYTKCVGMIVRSGGIGSSEGFHTPALFAALCGASGAGFSFP